MGLGRYLLHDFFTAQEFNRRDRQRRQAAKSRRRRRSRMAREREALRADLERVSLFAFGLAELCVRKGLLTPEELKTTIEELDGLDGDADGRLPVSSLAAAMAAATESGEEGGGANEGTAPDSA